MSEKIQEMQMLEHNLQNLVMQKQAFEMELNETISALEELEKTSEVYKIVGQLLMKTEKPKTKSDLNNKKKILELRIKSFETQESKLSEKLEELREEITKSVNSEEKKKKS